MNDLILVDFVVEEERARDDEWERKFVVWRLHSAQHCTSYTIVGSRRVFNISLEFIYSRLCKAFVRCMLTLLDKLLQEFVEFKPNEINVFIHMPEKIKIKTNFNLLDKQKIYTIKTDS